MKKKILLIMLVCAALCVTTQNRAEADTYALGDIDHNGVVNKDDATLLQKMALGQASTDGYPVAELDMNADGLFNRADATILLYFVLHRIQALPYTGK